MTHEVEDVLLVEESKLVVEGAVAEALFFDEELDVRDAVEWAFGFEDAEEHGRG